MPSVTNLKLVPPCIGRGLRSDADIAAEVRQQVLRRIMWADLDTVGVEVRDGVVTLIGQLERASLIPVTVNRRELDTVPMAQWNAAVAVNLTGPSNPGQVLPVVLQAVCDSPSPRLTGLTIPLAGSRQPLPGSNDGNDRNLRARSCVRRVSPWRTQQGWTTQAPSAAC